MPLRRETRKNAFGGGNLKLLASRVRPLLYLPRYGLTRLLCRSVVAFVLAFLSGLSFAQQSSQPSQQPARKVDNKQINVNWLYGSYIPKDVPIEPLTGAERWTLYKRMTFTTWGIYIKTALFSIHDQVTNSPSQWGDGIGGFGKRVATRQVQFVVQNSFTAVGDAAVHWELRYDRCRCDGFWHRTRHAIVRNFVTYDPDGKLRPQLMPYAAAFGGGAITATWEPGNPSLLVKGYQSAIGQVPIGIASYWIGEFAPEITRALRKKR